MAEIVILGSGSFGLSLAVMADKFGNNVTVWSAFKNETEAIRKEREHKQKLPGIRISETINLTSDISCLKNAEIVMFGIPSAFVRDVAKQAAPFITDKMVVVNTGKGLEENTFKTMSEVIQDEIKTAPVVALTGPSHAEEVGKGIPTSVVVAGTNEKAVQYVQDVLSNDVFRIYTNDDVKGCELGGALKNIIALSAGICDGLGYGDNTVAALITRGISEIARLGCAMGAKINTFSGLAGIGDLIVTCTSMHSRNRRAGILIGKGIPPEDAVKQIGTVEGYNCCKVAKQLSDKLGVEMPITSQLYKVLFDGGDVKDSLGNLMSRPKKHESEKFII